MQFWEISSRAFQRVFVCKNRFRYSRERSLYRRKTREKSWSLWSSNTVPFWLRGLRVFHLVQGIGAICPGNRDFSKISVAVLQEFFSSLSTVLQLYSSLYSSFFKSLGCSSTGILQFLSTVLQFSKRWGEYPRAIVGSDHINYSAAGNGF